MSVNLDTLAIDDGDAFYEALRVLHDGKTPHESAVLNFRIILLLANQVGDEALQEILRVATASE
ncbi:MAG: DUF2783 domain-containing protein [Actinobacteria bacterium]|nr:DUF2783 domain-containing protein [Actinomycetota bacterium]